MIREVRNEFAHRLEALDFNHPEIAELLKAMPHSLKFTLEGNLRDAFASGLHCFACRTLRYSPGSRTNSDKAPH
jgi:hypothetical protein